MINSKQAISIIVATLFAVLVLGISVYSIKNISTANEMQREEEAAQAYAESLVQETESETSIWDYLRARNETTEDEEESADLEGEYEDGENPEGEAGEGDGYAEPIEHEPQELEETQVAQPDAEDVQQTEAETQMTTTTTTEPETTTTTTSTRIHIVVE